MSCIRVLLRIFTIESRHTKSCFSSNVKPFLLSTTPMGTSLHFTDAVLCSLYERTCTIITLITFTNQSFFKRSESSPTSPQHTSHLPQNAWQERWPPCCWRTQWVRMGSTTPLCCLRLPRCSGSAAGGSNSTWTRTSPRVRRKDGACHFHSVHWLDGEREDNPIGSSQIRSSR